MSPCFQDLRSLELFNDHLPLAFIFSYPLLTLLPHFSVHSALYPNLLPPSSSSYFHVSHLIYFLCILKKKYCVLLFPTADKLLKLGCRNLTGSCRARHIGRGV
uniref:Uncharacterized protein n=1 Tax=Mola mola TaxID=94237 RepID=A0A3Q3WCX2_MOLML